MDRMSLLLAFESVTSVDLDVESDADIPTRSDLSFDSLT